MPDPLTDAGLRQRAEQWLRGELKHVSAYQMVSELLDAYLAAVDQIQPGAAQELELQKRFTAQAEQLFIDYKVRAEAAGAPPPGAATAGAGVVGMDREEPNAAV